VRDYPLLLHDFVLCVKRLFKLSCVHEPRMCLTAIIIIDLECG